jgi:ABC-type multidrug transport system ATPase subunit
LIGVLFIDLLILAVYIIAILNERKRIEKNVDNYSAGSEGLKKPESTFSKLRKRLSLDYPTNTSFSSGFEDRGVIEAFKKCMNGSKTSIKLKFYNMSLTLPSGQVILDRVSGEITPSKFTAIMGPSGAGKTTFINVLMGKINRTDGDLFINEVQGDLSQFKKIIGYVPQEDIMHRELTVRENLMHSARIRAPRSWSSKQISEYVDALLRALSLDTVAHSVIGDEHTRGVSGGQRKRVNIGMELAGLPLALFLDEPTSGLDSTAALNVATILKNMARIGLTTVAVIHQPRSEIFDELDDILLLCGNGRTAYLGPRKHIVGYFVNLGYDFDPNKNPADIIMDIVSHQLRPKASRRFHTPNELADEWEFYKTHGYHSHNADSLDRPKKNDYMLSEADILEQNRAFQQGSLQRPQENVAGRPDSITSFPDAPEDMVLPDAHTAQSAFTSRGHQHIVRMPVGRTPDNLVPSSATLRASRPDLDLLELPPEGIILPNLHRTVTKAMVYKQPAPVSIQQSSQAELLKLCEKKGASAITQFFLCTSRSFLQQRRHFLGFVWEMAVALLTGFLVAIAMLQLKGVFYRGILVEPFQLLSAAPMENLVPQIGLVFGMAVCIASAPAGVNVFGSETVVYYREAASGHNRYSYFLVLIFNLGENIGSIASHGSRRSSYGRYLVSDDYSCYIF